MAEEENNQSEETHSHTYSVFTAHIKQNFVGLFERFRELIKDDKEYLAFVHSLYPHRETIPKNVKLDGASMPLVYLFLKYLKEKHRIDYLEIERKAKRESEEKRNRYISEQEGEHQRREEMRNRGEED